MQSINHVTVIGMGALGLLYGDFFLEKLGAGSVTFLADPKRAEKYNGQEMFCNGKSRRFSVVTPEELSASRGRAELLMFAVKGTGLLEAVELSRPIVGEDTVILSVLNGITSEEIIEENLKKGTVIPCVAQGMDATKEGSRLSFSSMGELRIGISPDEEAKRPQLEQVSAFFTQSGFPFAVESDIRHRMWSKWMLNVGVNQVLMVEEGVYRDVQHPGPSRERMKAAMRETMTVAQMEGIPLTEADLEDYLALVDSLAPDNMPSMRQDGLARRPSEVELFAGTVLRKAERYGLDVPVNRELYRAIKEREAQY